MISIMNNVMKNLPWADRYGTSASLHFWILKKSIIFFWEKPTNETKRMRKGIRTHWQSKNYTPKEIHSKWRRKKKKIQNQNRESTNSRVSLLLTLLWPEHLGQSQDPIGTLTTIGLTHFIWNPLSHLSHNSSSSSRSPEPHSSHLTSS